MIPNLINGEQFVHHTIGKVWQEYESMTGEVATWQAVIMLKKQTVTKEIVACQIFVAACLAMNQTHTEYK
jgi:hypothetical protein